MEDPSRISAGCPDSGIRRTEAHAAAEAAVGTRAYVAERATGGFSKREIIRCLERYVARQTYRDLARART